MLDHNEHADVGQSDKGRLPAASAEAFAGLAVTIPIQVGVALSQQLLGACKGAVPGVNCLGGRAYLIVAELGGHRSVMSACLPMAGRTADDQARQFSVGHLLEQVDEELGEPVGLEAGEVAGDELPEWQRLAGRCGPVRAGNTQQPPVGPDVRKLEEQCVGAAGSSP